MTRFVEPSRLVPLRWGSYPGRYLAGLGLIVSGLICIQGSSAAFGIPMAAGTLAHVVGWWLMPAIGWRRIWAVLPSLLVAFILLIGPAVVGLLAVPFACWLMVRHRPTITLLLALPVLGVGIVVRSYLSEYDGMLPALAIMAAVIVPAAWAARAVAASRHLPSNRT